MQNEDPDFAGGANSVCLAAAHRYFVQFGYSSEECFALVRAPRVEEVPMPMNLIGLAEDRLPAEERRIRMVLLGIARAVAAGAMGVMDGCSVAAAVGWGWRTGG